MSNRRASEKGVEEPVKDGLRQLLDLTPTKISSKLCISTPIEVTSDCQRLMLYRDFVPGSKGSYPLNQSSCFDQLRKGEMIPVYTGMHDHLAGHCVVLRRKATDAEHIFKLLNRCDHPSVLKPTGAWESGDMVSLTFPRIEGTLNLVDESELFIIDSTGRKDGFTEAGLRAFRDLISAVNHINEKAYINGSVGTSSRTEDSDEPPPVLPLQLGSDRIFCQKVDATGAYHVYIGDFYASADKQRLPKTLKLDVRSIIQYNWKGLGAYLGNLIGSKANDELNHLRDVLKGSSSSSPITLDDILWEPALWDSATKMHFIREVYYSLMIDSTNARSAVLRKKPELGLQTVIGLLGVAFTDDNLLGSVHFLRNKIVAHQEDPFRRYQGDNVQDVGLDKSTLEHFLLKNKPDYMLKLVAHIRPLKWITQPPPRRSKSAYMKVLKRV